MRFTGWELCLFLALEVRCAHQRDISVPTCVYHHCRVVFNLFSGVLKLHNMVEGPLMGTLVLHLVICLVTALILEFLSRSASCKHTTTPVHPMSVLICAYHMHTSHDHMYIT